MIHRFGKYELDEAKGELRRDGETVRMQPKPYELLRLLIRERERIVSLEELFDALWPDTIVTPASLTRAVSHARRAIGDTGRGEVIRSHARRGYRFCAEIQAEARTPSPPLAPAAATQPAQASDPQTREELFVGREAALRQLLDAWHAGAAGHGSVAVVRGPAGIGKSRLVHEFANRAEALGARPLIARGRQGEGVPPLWIWTLILRELVRLPQFHAALRPLAEQGDDLAQWVPEFATRIEEVRQENGGAPSAQRSKEQRRFLLFDAASRSLAECSEREPLLIVLEDLHWSRSAALELLEHIAYEIEGKRVLIVVTVRDEAEPHPALRKSLASLQSSAGALEIPLEGFSRAEVAALLSEAMGTHAPSDLSSEVFARTEGIPLFVRETIRLLSTRGDLADPTALARGGVTLPMHSLELINGSLESLPGDVLDLVSAGAVLGRDFSVPLLAAIVESDRETVLDQIDHAVTGGVLELVLERPGHFRFAHALFRDAAYERLGPGERIKLHHRVARRLAGQLEGDPDGVLPELSHHLQQSLAIGDPEHALAIAERAAAHARSMTSDDQAALHYEQALIALDHLDRPDAERRLGLLIQLAQVYGFSGEREGRRNTAQRAMDLARSLDRGHDFARAAVAFCDLSEWSPDDPEAERALHHALQMLGDDEGIERAQVLVRLSYLEARTAHPDVEARGRVALAAARKTGDPDTVQEALFTLMFILAGPDRLGERGELAAELAELAPDAGDRDPALSALIDSACDAIAEGNADAAASRRKQAAAVCGRHPHQGLTWHLAVYDAGLALMEGRIEEGRALANHAVEIGRRISHPFANACWVGHIAEAHRWCGDAAESLRLLEHGIESATGPSYWLRGISGRSHVVLGNVGRARELLDQLAKNQFSHIPRGIRWLNSIVQTAHLCVELGDEERAAQLIPMLEPVQDLHGVFCIPINYGGPIAGALAGLEELCGHRERALEYARQAVQSTTALGAKPMEMRQRRDYAALLEENGETASAAQERELAERIAAELELTDALRP